MTKPRALVTGGAGFIGSHLVDALLVRGWEVVAYDSLVAQVHGPGRAPPAHLAAAAELIVADVCDRASLEREVARADVVFHHAAAVGVGQSMYDIVEFVDANVRGTAMLCEILSRGRHHVRKVVVASSMSNYGEGRYRCDQHGLVAPRLRPVLQLRERAWEVRCPFCAGATQPVATDESKPLDPTSVYATTKRDQEELVLNVARAYGIAAVALRYFNVYGPRQSLSNPYTGVAAIFASRILNGQAPLVFEDGGQSRDFVHVSDIVAANMLALECDGADGEVVNIGTGRATTLSQLCDLLLDHLGKRGSVTPERLGKFREGDVRHCFADITRARTHLGFAPAIPLESGVRDLVRWAREQTAVDHVAAAHAELDARRLIR